MHLRKIVVDGERWKWAVGKDSWWSGSEYTPPTHELVLTLQGPDGYRKTYTADDIIDNDAITPSAVADFIRKVKSGAVTAKGVR